MTFDFNDDEASDFRTHLARVSLALEQLPRECQIVFAIYCCLTLHPQFRAWWLSQGLSPPDLIERIVERCWKCVHDGMAEGSELQDWIDRLQALDDAEEGDTNLPGEILDSVACAENLILLCANGDTANVIRCTANVIDHVCYELTAHHGPHVLTPEGGRSLTNWEDSHPRMKMAKRNQFVVLALLGNNPRLSEYTLERLRRLAESGE